MSTCISDRKTETKFLALDLKQVAADGMFEGYASVFNREDLGRDVILPGAFQDTLKRRNTSDVKMLFQHDPSELIGVWEDIREDSHGLLAKGRLMTSVVKAREVLSLMRAGVLDGLSIGFQTVKSQRRSKHGLRKIEKVDLWEISIVTFPMMPEARIENVKRQPFHKATPTEREFERWLTRDAGLTRSEARALMHNGFKGLKSLRDADRGRCEHDRLKEKIHQAASMFQCN